MTAAFSAGPERKYRAAVSMEAWRVWVVDEADLVAFAAQADLAPSRAASDTSATCSATPRTDSPGPRTSGMIAAHGLQQSSSDDSASR